MNNGSFTIPYLDSLARHEQLDHEIRLFLPERAAHRPAVRDFVEGHYYEPFTHIAFDFILQKKGRHNVVHAGAFFGDMLHTLSKASAMVYAFEPVLENYYFSKKNIERLELGNIMLFNAGLASENGLLPIKTSDKKGRFVGGGSTFNFDQGSKQHSTEISPVLKLDDLPLRDVDLVELDVEGFELPALMGGELLIRGCKPVILIEDNKGNCADFLSALDYKLCFKTKGIDYWATGGDIPMLAPLEQLAKNMEFLEP